ncbi:MAG: hypothetical protein AAGK32_06035 [Actinomycetota bacterium]
MNPNSEPNPTRSAGRGFFKGLGAALLAVLALGLAASVVSAQTGGDEGDAEEPPAVDEEAFAAYRDCLEENGIEPPADGERPNRDEITDEQREAFRAAREACADVHPFAEEIAAARACLEENGVEFPADGERPNRDEITDEQRETFQAAKEACADVLPDRGRFGHGPRGPGLDPEVREQLRACLEENGVELPAEGERPNRDEITDEQREAFQAAREACADILPDDGPRGPRGFGGPGGPGGEAPASFGSPADSGLTTS